MAKYSVFVKTYGYASQIVEASSKKEAIEIARNNPNEWGSSAYSWWHDDNQIIKVEEVSNVVTYVPNCEKNEVMPHTSIDALLNEFAQTYLPSIEKLNNAQEGYHYASVLATEYGEVDLDVCANVYKFVQMVTECGYIGEPTRIPMLMLDFKHKDDEVDKLINECLSLNGLKFDTSAGFTRIDICTASDLQTAVDILMRYQTKRYKWVASSDDGCYEVDSQHLFTDKCLCYCDMRNAALAKMKWNTNYDEDFADFCDGDYIGYEVQFYQDKIIHKSYSGTYTYEIVEC